MNFKEASLSLWYFENNVFSNIAEHQSKEINNTIEHKVFHATIKI